ncbi:hypothetical protein BABINDRAFT_104197 [Babjeviella inositovora NRRL Y-12698]|uniref:Uncharacterized protein n=1 Tax=Babjeviella inositovora NRRL Y-12698 TaxID=984486 RepID=A0A1E3QJM5_9ASCO|nr:uncharacterized protein BABINDRAFT_104197 [Babjeviella inositovora NRRL Y-12698]ODQ77272.1 hypothetical protein BABINDRAFT_104197 [Babjeviella inositovora NRRL Y-12698]
MPIRERGLFVVRFPPLERIQTYRISLHSYAVSGENPGSSCDVRGCHSKPHRYKTCSLDGKTLVGLR